MVEERGTLGAIEWQEAFPAVRLFSAVRLALRFRALLLAAIGLVLATTLAVGTGLKMLIPDIPWAAAFVLGAIVSPPDAVAATSVAGRIGLSSAAVLRTAICGRACCRLDGCGSRFRRWGGPARWWLQRT